MLVANMFSDEVGEENSYKLYISTISPSGTELRLKPVTITSQTYKDFYEFLVPSIPREFAQGLFDQRFGKSLNITPGTFINSDLVTTFVNNINSTVLSRIQNINALTIYTTLIQSIIDRAYILSLQLLAADLQNTHVQKVEFEQYIKTALLQVIQQMQSQNLIDPRFLVS
jgi:hypothetical protein